MNRFHIIFSALVVLTWSSTSFSHHSRLGVFESDFMIDVEGVVTELIWANPHVRFGLEVTNDQGESEHWEIESTAISMLRSRGMDREFLGVGERVHVAGYPALNSQPQLLGMNILLENGTEVLIDRMATPYFANLGSGEILEGVFDGEAEAQARANADGIFRTWSAVLNDLASFPMFRGGYPLTESAAEIQASWDPDPEQQLSCWEKGMPILMVTPHPIEFVRRGENILIRFEEDDARRLIYMNSDVLPQESTMLGHSRGRWEGNTLVVETSHINAPEFDDRGTPMTENITLIERFTLSDDEQRLDYRITFTDPQTFVQPFDLTRYWVWNPQRAVQDWNCQD